MDQHEIAETDSYSAASRSFPRSPRRCAMSPPDVLLDLLLIGAGALAAFTLAALAR
ncbi:hypothetical protein ACVHYJ_33380 [Burkholderia pyrrocinia]